MANQPKSHSHRQKKREDDDLFATMAATASPGVEEAAPDGAEGASTSVQLKEEHNEAFAATLRKLSVENTKKDHCNRLQRMIDWMKTEYPD
jgi:hypothetical protein